MKKSAILVSLFVLSACTTVPVPVTAKFPSAPPALKSECPALDLLDKNAKLSDLLTTVTKNYVKYHDCAVKNDAWNEWYTTQKQIFENATK